MANAEGKDGLPSPFGRYTLVERLATGGMAEVFKAKISSSHGFEKMLVIKRILPNLAADKNFVSMFIDEAKLTAQLIHPKIVQVIDFGDVDGQLFIALEFIDGFDALALLRSAANKQLRLPIPIGLFITADLLDALDYAHNAKDAEGKPMSLVHRDISPSNVFIARRGDVKLGDFGIAHAQKRESKTQAGTLKGKYGYMSPEQVVGAPLDARSDLFAVGVVLAELITGRRLFSAPNDLDVLLMVRDGKLDRWNKYNKDVPKALDDIVRKALARRVADRFQSAADFRDALSDLLFQSGFRVGPSDLGRVSADYFDNSPEATERLKAQAQKWEMRLAGMGTGAITSEVAVVNTGRGPARPTPVSGVEVQTGSGSKSKPAPVASEEPLDVVIDEDILGGEVPSGTGKPITGPTLTPVPAAFVDAPASGLSGASSSVSTLGTAPMPLSLADAIPVSMATPARAHAPARARAGSPPPVPNAPAVGPSRHEQNIVAALDNLLAGMQPLAVVGLDQYAAPSTGVERAPAGVAGSFPQSGSGVMPSPTMAPDTAGSLLEYGPMRLLSELALAGETGLLRFLLAGQTKDVYVINGAPESVGGSARSERFGEYLVARGILRSADLERLSSQTPRFGGRTASALVGLGLLGANEVARLRAQHVREKIVEIAATPQGRFEFYRGAMAPSEGPPLGLDVFEIIGAGVLALSPEQLERRFMPEIDRRPIAIQPARVPPEAFRLGRPPRELWSQLDGRHSTRDWIAEIASQEDLLTFFRTLHLLLESGLATYV